MKKHKGLKIFISALLAVVILFCGVFYVYVSDYYKASESVSVLTELDTVSVLQNDDSIVCVPDNPKAGLIFYPGGKVEYTAYLPLMNELAKNDILCVLVHMPFNLAVFDNKAADRFVDSFDEIDKWYIGGHSLGGAIAASYVGDNADKFDGLILLGAYSTVDLSESSLNVITIVGSNDNIVDMNKYNSLKVNLPDNYHELVIDGGCHYQFGDYGEQKGDGLPTISRDEQINQTVRFIVNNIL